MAHDIGWHLYRTFLGILKTGSLSGAARALDITQPTAGRHVVALEKALNVVLFTRSQQGLLPTEAALALRGFAETMESTAKALERAASGQSQGGGVRGTVRISAAEVMGVEVLPPIIARLREQHPELKIELVLADNVHDLLRLEADIAVRNVRPQQEQLIARRIGQIELGLHAHKNYVKQHGTPRKQSELTHHTMIGYDQSSPFVRSNSKSLAGFTRDTFALRCDSSLAQLALIRCGAGVGVCQVLLAQQDDALIRVLPKLFALQIEAFVVMHEDLRTVPRCRATFDALVNGLQQYIR